MKIKHRIPAEAYFKSDPITPEYQREVDRSTAKSERREQDAQRRLASAQSRLAKALKIKAAPQRAHAVLVARELVELRRQELLAVQQVMQSSPSSASHRGTGHRKRPVPGMHTI